MGQFIWHVKSLSFLAASFASTIGLLAGLVNLAATQAPINSTNYDQIIKGGTYENTLGSVTLTESPARGRSKIEC